MTFVGPNGKQYVVIAAGGHNSAFGKFDNAIVAFALP
jgi:glucose dehydrogenase